jgi:EpsI family protein
MMVSLQQKPLIIVFLLIIAIVLAYGSPRPKYQSTNILKTITLPGKLGFWSGEDVKQQVNFGQKQYFFIDDIKTKKYVNAQGMTVYFTVLDAGNFHHPRVCFSGAGYTALDLPDTDFETPNGNFQAPTLFFKKKGEDTLVIYWLCINKQRVDWAGQKLKEFWFSLWGKKRTGFTIRLDIPITEENIKPAIISARNLVKTLSRAMPKDQAEYIFGK